MLREDPPRSDQVSGPMLEQIGARPIPEFDGVHDVWPRGERLRAVRSAAAEYKKRFVQQGQVRAVRSVDVAGAPYPVKYAFDNAVSVAAARIKGIESEVAGMADVLVVPDLESGNMLAKQLEYMGDAVSAGIVLGAKVPVVLTSRADPRESRLAACAIATLLAHRYRTTPP